MSKYSKIHKIKINGVQYDIHEHILKQFGYFEVLLGKKFADGEISLNFDVDNIDFDEFVDLMYKVYAHTGFLEFRIPNEDCAISFYEIGDASVLLTLLSIIHYLIPNRCIGNFCWGLITITEQQFYNKEYFNKITVDDIVHSNIDQNMKRQLIMDKITISNPYKFHIDPNYERTDEYGISDADFEKNPNGIAHITLFNIDNFFAMYNRKIKSYEFQIIYTEMPKWKLKLITDDNEYGTEINKQHNIDICSQFLAYTLYQIITGEK